MKRAERSYSTRGLSLVLLAVIGLIPQPPASAEVRVITATGEYRMGDNDTRTDAKRLALLDAKRLALEQAGSHIESITEVKSLDLTKEETRAYTAGIVEVVEQASRTVMDGETAVVRVDVMAKIDTDLVSRQIEEMSQSQNLRVKLIDTESHIRRLQRELDPKTQELAAATSRAERQAISQQRRLLIDRTEADLLTLKAAFALPEWQKHKSHREKSSRAGREYARALLNQALYLDPENASAHSWMGLLCYLEGRHEASVASYRKVVELEPESTMAHVELGLALDLSGDSKGALKEYAVAIQKDQKFASAYSLLGSGLAHVAQMDPGLTDEEKQRQYEYAEELLRKAIRLEPSNASFHVTLGRILHSYRANTQAAVAEFRTAIRLDPRDSEGYMHLGQVLSNLGDKDGAVKAFGTAVLLSPYDSRAHRAFARSLDKVGDKKRAIQEYYEVIRLEPGDAGDYWEIARCLEEQGSIDEAISQYRAALKIS